MTARPILQLTNPNDLKKLLKPSEHVCMDTLAGRAFAGNLIEDLRDTLYTKVGTDHPKAAGLSAVQIGVHKQVFVLHHRPEGQEDPVLQAFVNSTYYTDYQQPPSVSLDWSGCFSFDFCRVGVERPDKIFLDAHVFDVPLNGEPVYRSHQKGVRLTGHTAHMAEHEIGHQDAILTLHAVPRDELQLFTERNGGVNPEKRPKKRILMPGDAYRVQGRLEEAEVLDSEAGLSEDQIKALQGFLAHHSSALRPPAPFSRRHPHRERFASAEGPGIIGASP